MKNILKTIVMALVLMGGTVHAQDKFAQLDIRSNPVCDQCKHTLETEMLYVKGVHAVSVDVDAKIIHVEYRPKKTNPEKLRQAVSKIGYEADGLAPDMKARKALPACCQLEDHNDHPEGPVTPSEHHQE